MVKYVYDRERGIMVEKDSGLPMLNQEERARPIQCPRVFGDEEGFVSPVTGEWIEGKRAHREDLKRNNAIDGRELGPRKRTLKNKRFAEKRGLTGLLDDSAR